jgi:transposase
MTIKNIRHGFTDEQWNRIEPIVLNVMNHIGRPSNIETRDFLHAVRWMLKSGASWRDLPEEFGSWHLIYKRFQRWNEQKIFDKILQLLTHDADREEAMIDSSHVRVHQDSVGTKKKSNHGMRGTYRGRENDQDSLRSRRAWKSVARAFDAWERT